MRPYAVADDWQFRDVSLGTDRTGELADPVVLAERLTHPQGTQVELGALSFTESRIGVSVTVRDAGRNGIRLMLDDRTYLEDDLGNRHLSVAPSDASLIDVPAGSEVQGTISFAGAIDPAAARVSLGINIGIGGSYDSGLTLQPSFLVENALVTGEGDDFVISIPPNSTTSAEMVFAGRIADEAESIRLLVNQGTEGAATGRTTLTPTFTWEALALPERTGASWDIDPDSLVTPARTDLRAETLDRSAATVVAETVEDLDGSRTDEGVKLVVPDRVLFDFGSDVLRTDARQQLADLAGVLEYFAGAPVQVVGHTDSVGGAASNQALSERRAAAVVDALVGLGIDRNRLTPSGRGEDAPIAANTTPDGSDDPEGRQQNRRVEVIVETDEPIPSGD